MSKKTASRKPTATESALQRIVREPGPPKQRRVKLGIPTPDNNGLHMCHIGHKARERLIRSFCEIINLLCEREQGFIHDHERELFPVSYVLKDVGVFEPDVPPKLRELWEAIDEAVTDAMVRGEETGASLLKQLASGKATIHDYNEVAIRSDHS